MSTAGFAPESPTKRVAGFHVDACSLGPVYDGHFSPTGSEPSSVTSISPTMLTSPVRMPSDATAFSRSGLRSGFTASDQSEMTLNQTQASEGSPVSEFLPTFAEQAPGSLPFSTSFDWQQQQQQQQQPAHPRHGHSLSMPIFTPSNDFGSFAAAETSSSMVYPNYSLDSWPNSGLTPASGKAPSSSSVKRASRRPSVGSPRMTSDESVPRGLETQTMLQQMARSHSSPQSTLDHPSSVPAYQSRPGSNPDWLHSVSHTTASAQGSPFTTHLPGSAPGSLNAAPPERPTRNSAAGRSPEVEAKSSTSANDKRKKRRESHNLVERRRRDGINTAIEKLSDLLPEMLLEPSGAGQTTHHLAKAALRGGGGGVGAAEDPLSLGALQTQNSLSTLKPNKAVVLSKTVDYVQHLQELVQLQAHRNRELELALERIGTSPPPAAQSLPVFDPSVQLTHTASPQITAPFDEELFDMTSNMELA